MAEYEKKVREINAVRKKHSIFFFYLDGKYLHKKSAYSIIKSGVFFEYAFRGK